jgi:acid stress chaperone HdeB
MKASRALLALALALGGPVSFTLPVHAASIEIDSVKCKDFLQKSKEEIATAVAWLDGYYTGDDDPAVVDFDKLKDNSAKIEAYCTKHPDSTLEVMAEELFGGDK